MTTVVADPGGGVFVSDPKKPAGGHVLAHAATVRLMFRKGKGEQRICKVFDAPNLPESEAISLPHITSHFNTFIYHFLVSININPMTLNDFRNHGTKDVCKQ